MKSKSVERREAEQRKARHIPMTLGGDDPRTRLAFSVWRTGPHVGWHLEGLYETREDACNAAQRCQADGFTDGLVVRPVTFGVEVMRWEQAR